MYIHTHVDIKFNMKRSLCRNRYNNPCVPSRSNRNVPVAIDLRSPFSVTHVAP